MTNMASTYSFMDLLTDKGFVPATGRNTVSILGVISSAVSSLMSDLDQVEYGFMDLLKEKNMVPANDNIVKSFRFSDLSFSLSGLADKVSALFVETSDNLVDYGFMDLLKDKGHVVSDANLIDHSNDNDEAVVTIAS